MFVAQILVRVQTQGKEQINKVYKLILPIIAVAVPIFFILKQPDYGTAVAFVVALSFMLYIAGIRKRYIFAILIIGTLLVFALWTYIIPKYARHIIPRIEVFLNPELDPRGAGYNIIQSKLAIGSGHILGMGILQGNQTQMGYLYPKTTDFIFAVISEEMGFIISALVIIVYILLIIKIIEISKTARDNLGTYISVGIAGIFLYHMIENIGMTMGILPITGIPLPFISYGGSSLLTNFILIGIILNISARREKAIFKEKIETKG